MSSTPEVKVMAQIRGASQPFYGDLTPVDLVTCAPLSQQSFSQQQRASDVDLLVAF